MTRSHADESADESASVQIASSVSDRTEYLVRSRGDIWLIQHDGGEYGPYKDRHEATFFAIDAAHKFGRRGRNTHVCVVDQTGQPLTTWSYGTDPYPPYY